MDHASHWRFSSEAVHSPSDARPIPAIDDASRHKRITNLPPTCGVIADRSEDKSQLADAAPTASVKKPYAASLKITQI